MYDKTSCNQRIFEKNFSKLLGFKGHVKNDLCLTLRVFQGYGKVASNFYNKIIRFYNRN